MNSYLSVSLSRASTCTLQLCCGQEFATFPISCGTIFGHFANDVFEVVWMADYERRTQGHRFISVHHILFALSLSRVSDFVDRILGERLYCLAKEPSKVPIYIVYKLAADEASSLGNLPLSQ